MESTREIREAKLSVMQNMKNNHTPSVFAEENTNDIYSKYVALIVCWFLGNGCLFPWNSMLSIEDYYEYLFSRYHPSRVLTLVYQPFDVVTLAILIYKEQNLNTRRRTLLGYILFFISSLAILVIDVATSGKGGVGPFVGLCLVSCTFGVANAHVQGGLVGDISLMDPLFMQFYLAGSGAAGTLTSVLRLITKASFENSKDGLRKGAVVFFAISAIFELLCLVLYAFVFPKLPIVKYYRTKAALEGSKTVAADLAAGGINISSRDHEEELQQSDRLGIKELLLQNIDYALDLFLTHALTLSIFPGFLAEDTGSHGLGSWSTPVFVTVYNVWDFLGRYIPLFKFLKLTSRKGLMIGVLARFLFVPAFYFSAKYGDLVWIIILTSLLGASNGYMAVCVLTSAPKSYKGPEKNALGNLLVLFLVGGVFAGVTLDWLWLMLKY